ncbi:MAG: hypothetical protein ACXW61_16155 [Gemmatirosa sp.]
MRRRLLPLPLLLASGAPALRAQIAPPSPAAAAPRADTTAARFYLNYDVPESPALAVLGATATNVMRGAAAKPLALSLAGDVLRGDRIGPGLALDVAPYAYAGRFRNVADYQNSAGRRFLANVLTSFAAVQAPGDADATAFGAGVRLTLHDDHDLLQNADLARRVGQLLVPKTIACPKIGSSNICVAGTADQTVEVDVSSAYAAARDSVLRQRGWAASVGGAFGGTLRGGVARPDSLQQRRGHVWLAGTRYLGVGRELLAVAEWVRDTTRRQRMRAGLAYRLQSSSSAVAAELAYDSGAGGVLPGVNAEFRVLPRATLVAALVSEPPGAERDRTRLRIRTSIRWAAAEGF